MSARTKASTYEMRANRKRIMHALAFLIQEAQRQGFPVTQYSLVKTMFLADRAHLNKYGRPITYDNYVAMLHGPVPSETYSILRSDRAPWTKKPAPEISEQANSFRDAALQPSEQVLSPSDFEELAGALATVRTLTFSQLRKLTHEDAAYVDAWEDEGERAQYPMSYALLFDVPDDEAAQHVAFASQHV